MNNYSAFDIRSALDADVNRLIHEVLIFATLPSTNQYLLDDAQQNPQPRICIAHAQTQGRGRLGKHWQSPVGNLYFSLLWPFKTASNLSLLPLLTGIAVCETLKHYSISTHIKWPNDVMFQAKKMAGVLVESSIRGTQTSGVIGIGLNVCAEQRRMSTIEQPWTSLYKASHINEVTGNSMAVLISRLTNALITTLIRFEHKGYACIQDKWPHYDLTWQRPVEISINKNTQNKHAITQGIAQGIDSNGRLIIETKPNQFSRFSAGEVSLKCV